MKFQRLYRPAYQFVKKGKYYVKVEKIVNKFNGQEPNEPKIDFLGKTECFKI